VLWYGWTNGTAPNCSQGDYALPNVSWKLLNPQPTETISFPIGGGMGDQYPGDYFMLVYTPTNCGVDFIDFNILDNCGKLEFHEKGCFMIMNTSGCAINFFGQPVPKGSHSHGSHSNCHRIVC
jgi:hypothetical protein